MLVLAAAVGYTAFVAWQRKTGSPLMDVRLLARRPVATGAFLIAMATALMIAVFFLGTFYLKTPAPTAPCAPDCSSCPSRTWALAAVRVPRVSRSR